MAVPVTAQSFGIFTGLTGVTGGLFVPAAQRQESFGRPIHDVLVQYGLTDEEVNSILQLNLDNDFMYELVFMLTSMEKSKVLEYVYDTNTIHKNVAFEGPMMAETSASGRREEELLREGEKLEAEGQYECPFCGSSKDTISSTNFVRRGDEPPIIKGYCISCRKHFIISG